MHKINLHLSGLNPIFGSRTMTQHVKIHHLAPYSILSFQGIKNLDANSALRVKAEIKGLLPENTKHLIVDLQNIQFIDSTGFGTLISILKTMKSRDGRMILSGVSDEVRELMDLMQLLSVFELSHSLKEAESKLKP